MARRAIIGVDFSGGARAGRKIWIASGGGTSDALTIQRCVRAADLPGASLARDGALAALRDFIADHPEAAVGLDFPFGLPASLAEAATWEGFLERFPRRYPSPEAFRAACREAADGAELKRATDAEAATPFSAYNLWLYRQTFYGIRDVLRPLVLGRRAVVLPMQRPEAGLPWLLEICPASTLKRRGLYLKYKGKRAEARAGRQRILDALLASGSLRLSDDALRETALADTEGDVLDSIVAALAAWEALRHPRFPRPAMDHRYAIEGYVYC